MALTAKQPIPTPHIWIAWCGAGHVALHHLSNLGTALPFASCMYSFCALLACWAALASRLWAKTGTKPKADWKLTWVQKQVPSSQVLTDPICPIRFHCAKATFSSTSASSRTNCSMAAAMTESSSDSRASLRVFQSASLNFLTARQVSCKSSPCLSSLFWKVSCLSASSRPSHAPCQTLLQTLHHSEKARSSTTGKAHASAQQWGCARAKHRPQAAGPSAMIRAMCHVPCAVTCRHP